MLFFSYFRQRCQLSICRLAVLIIHEFRKDSVLPVDDLQWFCMRRLARLSGKCLAGSDAESSRK